MASLDELRAEAQRRGLTPNVGGGSLDALQAEAERRGLAPGGLTGQSLQSALAPASVEASPLSAPPGEPSLGFPADIFVPRILQPKEVDPVKQSAADAGVLFDKPAPSGHFLASLAANEDEQTNAFRVALTEEFGSPAFVRRGEKTGQIEFFDPETNRFSLANPPGNELSFKTFGQFGGSAMVMAPELAFSSTVAAMTKSVGPTLAAGAAGAFVGEVGRLALGREMGINQDMTDTDMIMAGALEGGIALAGGKLADWAVRWGKFVIDQVKGLPLPTNKVLDSLELPVDEAVRVQDEINERLGSEKLRFNLAQASADQDLLVQQEIFRKSPEFSRQFGALEAEQNEALNEFFDVVNRPFRTRLSGEETVERVQGVAQSELQRAIAREEVEVAARKSELDDLVLGIDDRPFETFGAALRDVGDAEQTAFREWSDEVADTLRRVTGDKEFIANSETAKVAASIDREAREALLPALQQMDRRLVGDPTVTAQVEQGGEVVEVRQLRKLFDPNAKFTFEELWRAQTRLGMLIGQQSKGLTTEAIDVGQMKRLYAAMQTDMREGMQATKVGPLFDNFKRRYNQEKTRLDEGAVGELMARRQGRNSAFRINNEDVFRKAFQPGGKTEAEQVMALISGDVEATTAMRQSVWDFYQRQVMPDGRVDLAKHKTFMKQYGGDNGPLAVYFTKRERRMIQQPAGLERALQAREASRDRALKAINKTFEAELTNLRDVRQLLTIVRASPENARRVVNILSNSPDVLRAVRTQYRKDIAEAVTVFRPGGGRGFSAKKLDVFLNGRAGEGAKGQREVIRSLFDARYIDDLQNLNKAIEIVQREPRFPNTSQTAFWTKTLTNVARAYVGLFTRPGRFITAFNQFRGRSADRLLARAILNPGDLRKLMSLRGVDLRSRKATTILGELGASALSADNVE